MNLTQKRLLDITETCIKQLEEDHYAHDAILDFIEMSEEEYQQIMNKKHKKLYPTMIIKKYQKL